MKKRKLSIKQRYKNTLLYCLIVVIISLTVIIATSGYKKKTGTQWPGLSPFSQSTSA